MPSHDPEHLHIDLDILLREPAETYHAASGRYLTSHQVLDFMKCPWLYHKKAAGLIDDQDSSAFLLGRAAHVRILEGRSAYEAAYAIGGPINPKTCKPFGSNTKAFADWAAAQGRPVISDAQAELIEQMAAGVAMNDCAVDLLLYGRAEGVVRREYIGVPCQSRLDWVHPHRGIVDLKTCDDLNWFEADARRFRYANQLAFYRAVLARCLDGVLVPVHFIAIEKKEPFRCGVWRVSDDALAIAQQENEAAIHKLLHCQRLDSWPTGYEGVRVLEAA